MPMVLLLTILVVSVCLYWMVSLHSMACSHPSSLSMILDQESDYEWATSSDADEGEVNGRVIPRWSSYQCLFESRGFRLDTFRDVKHFYQRYGEQRKLCPSELGPGYSQACKGHDENALCKDLGLPDNLFRGTRVRDGRKIVVKAVNMCSRELDVVRTLSTPPLRDDPRNHCIPVLDLIEVSVDNVAFIVMEEWFPGLIIDTPSSLRLFLSALRQCIENTVFMHNHHIVHLDISLHNVLADYEGHYACIDYECSRRLSGLYNPRVRNLRTTEEPPEVEHGEACDPYKIDIWALGVLILRACKLTGYYVPELMHLTKLMLHDNPNQRPLASTVLMVFDHMVSIMANERLDKYCFTIWRS